MTQSGHQAGAALSLPSGELVAPLFSEYSPQSGRDGSQPRAVLKTPYPAEIAVVLWAGG
jgi:hypothetical protein